MSLCCFENMSLFSKKTSTDTGNVLNDSLILVNVVVLYFKERHHKEKNALQSD